MTHRNGADHWSEDVGTGDVDEFASQVSGGFLDAMLAHAEFATARWHGLHRPPGRTEFLFDQFLDAAAAAGASAEVSRWREDVGGITTNVSARRGFQLITDGAISLSEDERREWERVDESEESLETVGDVLRAIVDACRHDRLAMFALSRVGSRVDRDGLIYASVLTVLVAQFEDLVRSIVRLFFKCEEWRTKSQSFTLDELRSVGPERLEETAVERAVNGVMSDFWNWREWLSRADQLGCLPESLSFDADAFVEAFARRNAHVHSGGRVTDRYFSRVVDPVSSNMGEYLAVTSDYLRSACENMVCVGLRLVALTTKRLARLSDELAAMVLMLPLAYDLPLIGFWRAIPELAKTVNQADCPLGWKHEAHVLAMWARRQLGEDVSEEVSGWDTTGLGIRVALGKALLLKDPSASQLWSEALADGAYSERELGFTPLLMAHRELLLDE